MTGPLTSTRHFFAACKALVFQPTTALVMLGAIAASLFLFLGLIQFPGMHADADAFVPIILNVAAGKGWVLNGYTPMLMRQAGDNVYAGHGFLFPFIVGGLFGATSGKAVYIWSGVINAFAVLMYSLIAYCVSPRRSLSKVFYAVLLGICAGVIGIAIQGRPEQLALLIVPAPLMVWLRWRHISLLTISSAFAIAVLSSISPLLGIYWWLAYSVFLVKVLSLNMKRYLVGQFFVIGASFVLYALVINLITGSSIVEYVERILLYGRSPFIQGYTILALGSLRLDVPLWPLPLLIIAFAACLWLLSNRLFIVFFLVLVPPIFLARLVGSYIYLPFLPTAILVLDLRVRELRWRPTRLAKHIVVLFLFLYLLVFVRHLALASLYLHGSSTYGDTQEKIQRVQAAAVKRDALVGYGLARFPSLAVFGSAGRELIAVDARVGYDWARDGFEKLTKKQIAYIILPQEGQASDSPPSRLDDGKFVLIENYWTSRKSMLFGLKLGGYEPGYRVAIYKKGEP